MNLDSLVALNHVARPDYERCARTGMPEVIFAERKTITQCLSLTAAFLENQGRAILSRVSPELLAALHEHFTDLVEVSEQQHMPPYTIVVRQPHQQLTPTGGRVGILTAGTSDIPVAAEAAVLCRELGCVVQLACDVGVAGLHRLHEPLTAMLSPPDAVDVIIVVAGMDGALPSVVAGLVDVPVLGLPTSIGYGIGGGGLAALLSMLQSCAPGLAVVNIDNGIGAAAIAANIATRVARARAARETDA